MKFEKLIATLVREQGLESLRQGWVASMACLPHGPLPFLDSRHLRSLMAYASVAREDHALVLRCAAAINSDEALKALAWHGRRMLYETEDEEASAVRAWPDFKQSLGDQALAFYFILALAAVDYIRSRHRVLRIPETVTRDTCADINRFRPCCVGLRVRVPGTLLWLRHSVTGTLFKVGRLQYMPAPFKGHILVFRHRTEGETIALAEDGQRFNTEGFYDGDCGVKDSAAWVTTLSMEDHQVRGYPVAPTGQVPRHEVSLRKDTWHRVLARGDPVLEIHIPPIDPMPPAAVRASLRDAAAFFARFMPHRPWRAFSCRSWLFNPQLQDVLGLAANIPAWQREHYLYPVAAAIPAGLNFIFGFQPFDLRTAPRDTRLRKAVAGYLERGTPWHNGGMFGLPEDIPSFGQQVYLRRWPRIARGLGIPAGFFNAVK